MCDAQCSDLLKCNNDKILTYIQELRKQRDEVVHTIRKQEEEKSELAMEMERLVYKMNILSKSLAQRLVSRDRYNEAIVEAEEYYDKLVKSSEALLNAVAKDFDELYESMDKKVGPDIINKGVCDNFTCTNLSNKYFESVHTNIGEKFNLCTSGIGHHSQAAADPKKNKTSCTITVTTKKKEGE